MSLPEDLKGGPVALVCLGGVSTPDTRAAVGALQDASAELDRHGVRLIALTTSDLTRVQEFVSRYHVLFPMVADPDCALRSKLGSSPSRTTDFIRGLAREVARPGRNLQWGRGWVEGGAYALASCMVLGQDGTVQWAADGIHVDAMVQAAAISRSE